MGPQTVNFKIKFGNISAPFGRIPSAILTKFSEFVVIL